MSVDDVDVPRALVDTEQLADPGMRHVVAKHGDQVVKQNVDLREGEHRTLVMKLTANSPPPAIATTSEFSESKPTHKKSIQPVFGWISVGIGAAGLAVGTTAGILAEVKLSKLHNDGCRDRWCPSSFSGRVNSYNQLLTVSTVGFIVGAPADCQSVGAQSNLEILVPSATAPVPMFRLLVPVKVKFPFHACG